ncbi:MAG: hypothetical protein K2X78_00835 [Burkholderiaceae bacterium]|nr:hypothetical protein [Burkholderiaceae bacterium]
MNKLLSSLGTYLLLASLALVGMYLARDGGAFVMAISQIPLVGSMLAALFQLVRDDAAHARAAQLQVSQHGFALGVESHMAKLIFERHVEFCEAYATEINRTLAELNQQGIHATGCAGKLFTLRLKYSLWLEDKAMDQLKAFEDNLFDLEREAGNAEAFRQLQDEASLQSRKLAIDNARRCRAIALGEVGFDGAPLPKGRSCTSALGALRTIVDTEMLSKLRKTFCSDTA